LVFWFSSARSPHDNPYKCAGNRPEAVRHGRQKRIGAAVGDFAAQSDGLKAAVDVTDLRLVGVAYDAKTLRLIGDAKGTVNVAISKLAM
jgi:hypothetical protein